MNDETAKQLIKQLKIINFWITLTGITVLVGMIVIGILLFQVITFVRDTSNQVTNFTETTQQKLDIKQQACEGSGSFSDFLKEKTKACE